jgi:choline dehydrogenase-like flavoprotein
VLATGAVENARLLLAARDRFPAGLGNAHDRVGRYFMEHLSVQGGLFVPNDARISMGLYEMREAVGVRAQGTLVASPETLRNNGLLSARAYLSPSSSRTAMRSLWFGLLQSGTTADGLAEHVGNLLRQIDDLAIHGYRTFFQGSPPQSFAIINHVEHAPNPDSRVTLTDRTDALGMPTVRLDWRFGELERHTLRRTNELLGREFGRAGLGRGAIVPDDPDTGWPPLLRGAWHQMGTTRMHADPRRGVVDANCRVHGIANLFIAGSSVFPTSGYMNPTLTIVALALRLADHLETLLG